VLRNNHHKDKSQNGSEKNKTRNSGVEPTRWLRESVFINCKNCDENTIFQNEKLSEKLINYQTVKGKPRLRNSLEKQSNGCTNCQILEGLFHDGIRLTNSTTKLGTNWPKVNNGRVKNTKVPFKMKRETFVRAKKMKVKMKTNSKQYNFGKPKWKIKNLNYVKGHEHFRN
jgi:hypothetical protein